MSNAQRTARLPSGDLAAASMAVTHCQFDQSNLVLGNIREILTALAIGMSAGEHDDSESRRLSAGEHDDSESRRLSAGEHDDSEASTMTASHGVCQQEQARFWDDHFEGSDASAEWLLGFDKLQPLLASLGVLDRQSWLLTGCGTSPFGKQLDKWGPPTRSICSVDISQVAISRMQALHRDRPNLEWLCGDCTELQQIVGARTFDVVLDKCLLDSLLFRNRSRDATILVDRYLQSVEAVMVQPGGVFCVVSPRGRIPQLSARPSWQVRRLKVPGSSSRANTLREERTCSKSSAAAQQKPVYIHCCWWSQFEGVVGGQQQSQAHLLERKRMQRRECLLNHQSYVAAHSWPSAADALSSSASTMRCCACVRFRAKYNGSRSALFLHDAKTCEVRLGAHELRKEDCLQLLLDKKKMDDCGLRSLELLNIGDSVAVEGNCIESNGEAIMCLVTRMWIHKLVH